MMEQTGIERLEAALRAAVLAHRRALRAEIERETSDFSLRFLLARLGVGREVLEAIVPKAAAADLAPSLRHHVSTRLNRESTRLVRLARAGSPAYDMNRHVAVSRALRWLGSGTAEAAAVTQESAALPSGRTLNARFRQSRRPRRSISAPPAAEAPTRV